MTRLTSPLLCLAAVKGAPDVQSDAKAELARRSYLCGPADLEQGRQDAVALQRRIAELGDERPPAASSPDLHGIMETVVKLMILVGSAGMIAAPPHAPPPMVQCHTDRFGNTTCF